MWRKSPILGLCLLLLVGVLSGCGPQGSGSDYSQVELSEAPAVLQSYYERTRDLPGLFFWQQDQAVYLLLVGGQCPAPGMRVEVLQVGSAGQRRDGVRVLSILRPGPGASTHPYAVLRMRASANQKYEARLSLGTGEVLELSGMRVYD
ncbi:MAG: hypothetical protein ACM3XM_05750 [Mycobacterium leprae]